MIDSNNVMFDSLYSKSTDGIVRKVTYNIVNSHKSSNIYTTIETKASKNILRTTITTGTHYGQSNHVTIFERAKAIVERKIELKLRNGYKTLKMLGFTGLEDISFSEIESLLTIEKTDKEGNLKVMKAIQFKESVLIDNQLMIGQPKINGFRATLKWERIVTNTGLFSNTKEGAVLRTKENLYYYLPHITDNLTKDFFLYEDELIQYDGELYIPNTQLNIIRSHIPNINYNNDTISKCRYDSTKVSFWIFDLSIPDVIQSDRLDMLHEIQIDNEIPSVGIDKHRNTEPIVILEEFDLSINNYNHFLDKAIDSGYEGIMFRKIDGLYGFGSRNQTMMKLKKSKTTECKIIDVILKEEETNEEGNVRTYISLLLENDINHETFESTPEGDEEYRLELLSNRDKYIGKFATVRFYERSGVKKVPFHSNVILIGRETIGDLDTNDINIEL